MNGNRLEVILQGSSFLYHYDVVQEGKRSFEQEMIVQFDPKLEFGQMRVADVGKQGALIRIFRETTDESGYVIEKELLTEDFYAPIYRKEVHSLIAPVVVEIPPEIEEEDSLEESDSEEVGDGLSTDDKTNESNDVDDSVTDDDTQNNVPENDEQEQNDVTETEQENG